MENKDWRDEAREEWHVRTFNMANEVSDYSKVEMLIADWWIEKIDSLLKSKQEEIEGELEKMKKEIDLTKTVKRGTATNANRRKLNYNQSLDDLKPIINNILKP